MMRAGDAARRRYGRLLHQATQHFTVIDFLHGIDTFRKNRNVNRSPGDDALVLDDGLNHFGRQAEIRPASDALAVRFPAMSSCLIVL